MKRVTLAIGVLLLLIIGMSWAGLASPAGDLGNTIRPGGPFSVYPVLRLYSDWAWVNDPLDGDDQPFAAARRQIDQMSSSGVDLQPVISQYDRAAIANPKDALAQFRWAYAQYVFWRMPHAKPGDDTYALEIASALAGADQPHSYNYARVRILYLPDFHQELPLEARLVAHDPGDYPIASIYAATLSLSKAQSDLKRAIALERQIVSSGRYAPTCYRDLMYVYMDVSLQEHTHEYFRQAIDAGNKFLQETASYDCRRIQATTAISGMEKQIASGTGPS